LIVNLGQHDVILGKMWMTKFDILPDCRRKRLLWPNKQSLKDQITTGIVKIVPIQILKKPQTISKKHQQDADRRNRTMDRQIAKETGLQRGILGISSPGTPQSKKDSNVIQGQHKGPLDKPSTDDLRDVNIVQGQHRPPLEKPSRKAFPGDPKATANMKVKQYLAPRTYQQDHQGALQKMKQALHGLD
jgi:hypothetical protein